MVLAAISLFAANSKIVNVCIPVHNVVISSAKTVNNDFPYMLIGSQSLNFKNVDIVSIKWRIPMKHHIESFK